MDKGWWHPLVWIGLSFAAIVLAGLWNAGML